MFIPIGDDNRDRRLTPFVNYAFLALNIFVFIYYQALGNDIGSTWRNLNTWATVYQNVRLLPLTLFSSLVDPMGLVARGAPMSQAYDTFLRGMREVGNSWRDMFAK